MNVERKHGRRVRGSSAFIDPIISRSEDSLVFLSPVTRKRISNDIVEGFVDRKEVLRTTTVKCRTSQYIRTFV